MYGTDVDGVDHKGAYLTKEFNIVGGVELTKQYVYDHNTGNKKAEIDENGNRTDYEYDALERNTKVTYPDQTYRQYTYKDYPNADREVEYLDQNKTKFQFTYDIFDNIIHYSLFENNLWKTLAQTEHDFRGNKVSETDANGNKTTYEYSSDSMLNGKTYYEKDTTKKENIKLAYTYGISNDTPIILTLTDEDGYIKKYYYDAAEQLVKYEETPDNTNYFAKTFTYNYIGSVASEKDALNGTTTYGYDNLGRLGRKIDALNNETVYSYNNLDNVLTEEAPGGKNTENIYDTAGRIVEVHTYTKSSGDYYYKNMDMTKPEM